MGNLILYGDYINGKKEEIMKKRVLVSLLVLSVIIFTAEFNTDNIDIYYKGGKYYPAQDGIVLEGENTFIVGKEFDKLKQELVSIICKAYSVKKIEVTYEKSKVAEKAVCYDHSDNVITKNKK